MGLGICFYSEFPASFSWKKKGIQEHISYFCVEKSNPLLCANLGGNFLL
jgi:hypothetical protein